MTEVRYNWTKEEITDIYNTPLLDLIYKAASIHRENKDYAEVQKAATRIFEHTPLSPFVGAAAALAVRADLDGDAPKRLDMRLGAPVGGKHSFVRPCLGDTGHPPTHLFLIGDDRRRDFLGGRWIEAHLEAKRLRAAALQEAQVVRVE